MEPASDELRTSLLPTGSQINSHIETTKRESESGTLTIINAKNASARFSKQSTDQIPPCDEELQEAENDFWNKYFCHFPFNAIKPNRRKEQEKWFKSFEDAVLSCDLKLCTSLIKKVNIFSPKVNKRFCYLFLLAAKSGYTDILKLMLGDDENYQNYGHKPIGKLDKDIERSSDVTTLGINSIINVTDHQNSTALHLSIKNGHASSALYLISKGIDVSIRDLMLNLPIHLASSKQNMMEVVKSLLNKGQDIYARNRECVMPIHIAAAKGHLNILKVLIKKIQEKETSVELTDDYMRYPLHYAAVNGHNKCCDELLKFDSGYVNSKDNKGYSPLLLAAKQQNYLCCRSLREYNADLTQADPKGNTALHLAAKGGCIKTIRSLIDQNCDIKKLLETKNMNKETPVHLAASQPKVECLKVLLESLSKFENESFTWINESKQGLVHLSAKYDCIDSLTFLLADSVNKLLNIIDERKEFRVELHSHDVHGKTPLHYACENAGLNCVETLIRSGANVVSRDKQGNTPLHFAAAKGNVELCMFILENVKTSAVNKRNKLGETPLHLAVKSNSPECCAFLVKIGAFIHVKNTNGLSPYLSAVMLGNFEVVKKLSAKSLPIEAFEEADDTALHLVAKHGCTNICKFFLSRIDEKWIYKRNLNCNSALDEAFNSGNDEIFSLILSKYKPFENYTENKQFQLTLHAYMDIACDVNGPREKIQKAIVESNWWFTGISACFHKDQKCYNLLHLIKFAPSVAEEVFDKCLAEIDGKKVYDSRIFEQSFYKRTDITEHSELPFKSPFDLKSGKISQDNSLLFDYWNGEIESPLHGVAKYYSQSFDKSSNAAGKGYSGLIRHPLVDGYWNYKWHKYLRYVFWMILLFETIMITVLSLYISHIWNWKQVEDKLNISVSNCTEEYESELAITLKNFSLLLVLRIILFVMAVGVFCSEIYLATKVHWRSLVSVGVILRIIRFLGISILIIPFTTCFSHMWIVMTWQWQCGVLSLLASWFNMIHILNLVPALSVFMPITKKFIKSFLRVSMFITLILFTFAFIFFLLLNGHPAFSNPWEAFIKSIVWMWGDLAYDDLFLSNEYTILYPIMSKIIFIVFVTSIGGFIINLVLTQPNDHFESFKNDAACYAASLKIDIILRYDAIVSCLRERHTVALWVENCEDKEEISSIFERHFHGQY